MPAMLRDVLAHGLASQPDIAVAADVARTEHVADAVRRSGASAVVTCSNDGRLPDGCRRLLDAFPRLRIIVLTTDGRAAALYRLVLHRTCWTDIAPEDVLTALRHRDADPDGVTDTGDAHG
jgi:DNA-binding NarL/FixJ family response regulator